MGNSYYLGSHAANRRSQSHLLVFSFEADDNRIFARLVLRIWSKCLVEIVMNVMKRVGLDKLCARVTSSFSPEQFNTPGTQNKIRS
jgi:hypothetical protein